MLEQLLLHMGNQDNSHSVEESNEAIRMFIMCDFSHPAPHEQWYYMVLAKELYNFLT